MSRIRTVKPELFRHSDLYDAEKESGLPIRLAFIGLFTVCDRRGRFKWRPRDLKVEILPHDDCDFSRVLDACLTRGFIIKYQVDEQWYGCIPTFELHQVINNRESESVLPPPPEKSQKQVQKVTRGARVDDASGTREAREGHADTGEGKGRERKGKEGVITPLPPLLDNDAFKEAWKEWIDYRKERHLPAYKPIGLKRALNEISSFADPVDAVKFSISKNWNGVYERKETHTNGKSKRHESLSENVRRVDRQFAAIGIDTTRTDGGEPALQQPA